MPSRLHLAKAWGGWGGAVNSQRGEGFDEKALNVKICRGGSELFLLSLRQTLQDIPIIVRRAKCRAEIALPLSELWIAASKEQPKVCYTQSFVLREGRIKHSVCLNHLS